MQVDKYRVELYSRDFLEAEERRRQNVPTATHADNDAAFASREKISKIGDVEFQKSDGIKIAIESIGRRAGVAVDEQIHLVGDPGLVKHPR